MHHDVELALHMKHQIPKEFKYLLMFNFCEDSGLSTKRFCHQLPQTNGSFTSQ